jgi:hypothetical protein
MGNKQSRGPNVNAGIAIECNCERVMPQVIKECCESVSAGVENTFLTGLDGMLGPNATLVTNALSQNNNDWMTTYSNYVENINTAGGNNIEPFAPTTQDYNNRNYCDCDGAARQVIAQCEEGSKKAAETIGDIIDENSDLFDGIYDAGEVIGNYASSSNPTQEPDSVPETATSTGVSTWLSKYFTPTRTTSVENYEDIGLYKFVRQSLESRHRAFKNSPRFAEDCKNNATHSIRTFLGEELDDLNTLYKYYTTFVADHKTLLLDRGSMTDIISNKVAMLQELQAKIDKYKTSLQMDNRKNIYLDSNHELYKTIYFYYIIVYYSLIVLYLIFSKFISEKQYTNKVALLLLFIYLIIPIILSYLMNLAYDGYIYYLESLNLKEDTPTYNSLIEKM